MHRALHLIALTTALLAAGCTTSAPPADGSEADVSDGGTPNLCSGASTPDVSMDLGCDVLAGRYPCTYCIQIAGEPPDGGTLPDGGTRTPHRLSEADRGWEAVGGATYVVYPGICTCP